MYFAEAMQQLNRGKEGNVNNHSHKLKVDASNTSNSSDSDVQGTSCPVPSTSATAAAYLTQCNYNVISSVESAHMSSEELFQRFPSKLKQIDDNCISPTASVVPQATNVPINTRGVFENVHGDIHDAMNITSKSMTGNISPVLTKLTPALSQTIAQSSSSTSLNTLNIETIGSSDAGNNMTCHKPFEQDANFLGQHRNPEEEVAYYFRQYLLSIPNDGDRKKCNVGLLWRNFVEQYPHYKGVVKGPGILCEKFPSKLRLEDSYYIYPVMEETEHSFTRDPRMESTLKKFLASKGYSKADVSSSNDWLREAVDHWSMQILKHNLKSGCPMSFEDFWKKFPSYGKKLAEVSTGMSTKKTLGLIWHNLCKESRLVITKSNVGGKNTALLDMLSQECHLDKSVILTAARLLRDYLLTLPDHCIRMSDLRKAEIYVLESQYRNLWNRPKALCVSCPSYLRWCTMDDEVEYVFPVSGKLKSNHLGSAADKAIVSEQNHVTLAHHSPSLESVNMTKEEQLLEHFLKYLCSLPNDKNELKFNTSAVWADYLRQYPQYKGVVKGPGILCNMFPSKLKIVDNHCISPTLASIKPQATRDLMNTFGMFVNVRGDMHDENNIMSKSLTADISPELTKSPSALAYIIAQSSSSSSLSTQNIETIVSGDAGKNITCNKNLYAKYLGQNRNPTTKADVSSSNDWLREAVDHWSMQILKHNLKSGCPMSFEDFWKKFPSYGKKLAEVSTGMSTKKTLGLIWHNLCKESRLVITKSNVGGKNTALLDMLSQECHLDKSVILTAARLLRDYLLTLPDHCIRMSDLRKAEIYVLESQYRNLWNRPKALCVSCPSYLRWCTMDDEVEYVFPVSGKLKSNHLGSAADKAIVSEQNHVTLAHHSPSLESVNMTKEEQLLEHFLKYLCSLPNDKNELKFNTSAVWADYLRQYPQYKGVVKGPGILCNMFPSKLKIVDNHCISPIQLSPASRMNEDIVRLNNSSSWVDEVVEPWTIVEETTNSCKSPFLGSSRSHSMNDSHNDANYEKYSEHKTNRNSNNNGVLGSLATLVRSLLYS